MNTEKQNEPGSILVEVFLLRAI